MDLKRVKLLSDLVKKLFQNSRSISQIKLLSTEFPAVLQTTFSVLNAKQNYSSTFGNMHQLTGDYKLSEKLNQFPIPVAQSLSSSSPNQKYQAVVQSVPDKSSPSKTKQVLEIYDRNYELVQELLLDDFHEKIEGGPVFGKQLIWNQKENKILYIASPKEDKGKSFLDLAFDKSEDLKEVFKFHLLQQDLGEQMNGAAKPNLYQYDLEKNVLEQILLPDNIVPCYPQYVNEEGDKIVLQGFVLPEEFKYGIIHCFNRKSNIYLLDSLETSQLYPKPKKEEGEEQKKQASSDGQASLEKEATKPAEKKVSGYKILSEDPVAMHPLVSFDLQKVAYFGCAMSLTHVSYMALKLINLSDLKVKTVLPLNDQCKDTEVQGICGYYDDLQATQWMKDSKHLLFSSNVRGAQRAFVLNTASGEYRQLLKCQLNSDETGVISYNKDLNIIFADKTQMTEPAKVFMINNINLEKAASVQELVDAIQIQTIDVVPRATSDQRIVRKVSEFMSANFKEELIKEGQAEGFLWYCNNISTSQFIPEIDLIHANNEQLNPKKYADQDRPMLVLLHGGPHGSIAGMFTILRSYLMMNGFVILAPNFTGSSGFGQKRMEDLLGKIGDADANEVVGMINQVISRKMCNEKKIFVMGGSYGGYLSAMLAGKFGQYFRGAVLQNPVLNISFTANISDIPEWGIAEALAKDIRDLKWNLTPEQYSKMMELSPMNYPSKVPILLLLGQKDKRVPYQQGIAYHAQTVSNKVKISTYVYPESDHRLDDSLTTNFDIIMKIILFFEENLLQQP